MKEPCKLEQSNPEDRNHADITKSVVFIFPQNEPIHRRYEASLWPPTLTVGLGNTFQFVLLLDGVAV